MATPSPITLRAFFKHRSLRYPSGSPVIGTVTALRKGKVYWWPLDLNPDAHHGWEFGAMQKFNMADLDQNVEQIINDNEAMAYMEKQI
jgi:hypothetical protein